MAVDLIVNHISRQFENLNYLMVMLHYGCTWIKVLSAKCRKCSQHSTKFETKRRVIHNVSLQI